MLDLSLIDPKICLIKVFATRENTANDVCEMLLYQLDII